MKLTNSYEVSFRAAHIADGEPLSMHTWTVTVEVSGGLDPKTGVMLGDRGREVAEALRAELHGRNLKEALPGSYPTPEALAAQLLERLRPTLLTLVAVSVSVGNQTCRAEA